MTDGRGATASATVTVTVRAPNPPPVNRPPAAFDDIVETDFETPVTIAPLVNDSDPDGDPLTLVSVDAPDNGTATIVDGRVVYTPSRRFSGVDEIGYAIADGLGGTAQGAIRVTVRPLPVSDLRSWTITERDGTAGNRGIVSGTARLHTLSEGDSFITSIAVSFVVPDGPAAVAFTFQTPEFDRSATSLVRDAVEVALLDDRNRPLTTTLVAGRDAFLNITEGLSPTTAAGVTIDGSTYRLDLSGVPTGTRATLVFRLVNNDTDTNTRVTLGSVNLPGERSTDAAVKFFVVDPAADRTFRYGVEGLSAGTFDAPTGDVRGAASNRAGDTVWAIDRATKQVSVTSATGTTLGNWTATDAVAPEGVSVWDGDLWLVDRGPNRVRYYTGGAVKRIGDANETAGFSLDPENTSPSDLVTDGSRIWVTDDQRAEVFVYTTDGTLDGRWALDTDNADPSGITLDPSGGADLWVVDRVAKTVFQYAQGRNQRAGSLGANGTFRLNPANVAPEGIADPPPQLALDPIPSQVLAETHLLVSGTAISSEARLTDVTINGSPVEVFDAAGRFFSHVAVRPSTNTVVVTAHDSDNHATTETASIVGTQLVPGSVDFSQFIDLSASFAPQYASTSFDADTRTLFADVAVQNRGQYPTNVPLYVAVKNLSDPAVTVLNVAGTTPEGLPYYDFTGLVTGKQLAPDGTTGTLSLAFANPNRGRFTYEFVFLCVLNHAPAITSLPGIEATVESEYRTTVTATDPDNDSLTFALGSGPVGMTIDPISGAITWTPTVDQKGNHEVIVRADDGRGGVAEQRFTLTATDVRPNRPPVVTSLPITEAQVGESYRYDVNATDADGDPLAYAITVGNLPGLTIDDKTGVITWTPRVDQRGDRSFTVRVSDGNGGTAEQSVSVCVKNDRNRGPVIVSEPVTVAHITNYDSRSIILPYGEQGYRYKVVVPNAEQGFEAVGFDDSTFGIGTAGFGTGRYEGTPNPVTTSWNAYSDLLIRKNIDLNDSMRHVRVTVSVDNRFQMYFNG